MNQSSKILGAAIICLSLLVGLTLLLFPFLQARQSVTAYQTLSTRYDSSSAALSSERTDAMWSSAETFNASLYQPDSLFWLSEEKMAEYKATMDILGTGMIGYVEIEKLHLSLPFYHTASEEVLKRGAGHLEWTSLPTGAPSTHTVIGAHNGYEGKELFLRLPELEIGDHFSLLVLDQRLTYEVDQLMAVYPNDISALFPEEGLCLCTLFTCIGTGDSHRLLVRGQLVSTEPATRLPEELPPSADQ